MGYDWYHPRILFVRVPASDLDVLGMFKEISQQLAMKAFEIAGRPFVEDDNFIYMPIHELQAKNVAAKFKNIEILDSEIYLPALAQSSIR